MSLSTQILSCDSWLYLFLRCSYLTLSVGTRILDTFAKLRKATVSFLMSVCLAIRPSVRMEPLDPNWTDFHEIYYMNIFRKSVEKSQVS